MDKIVWQQTSVKRTFRFVYFGFPDMWSFWLVGSYIFVYIIFAVHAGQTTNTHKQSSPLEKYFAKTLLKLQSMFCGHMYVKMFENT